jgi:hypothetical protein
MVIGFRFLFRHRTSVGLDCVVVADLDHQDRRQRRATLDGEPDALPAAAGERGRPELVVELRGPVRLRGAPDRLERDLVQTTARAGRGAAGLVVDGQPAEPATALHAVDQRGAAPGAGRALKGALGLDLGPRAHAVTVALGRCRGVGAALRRRAPQRLLGGDGGT